MPFRKSWKQRRRHSSFCSSITEIPITGRGDHLTATTSISATGSNAATGGSKNNNRSIVDNVTIVTGAGAGAAANRRFSEQPIQPQQHFVVMDIITEDKVEV